LRAPDDVVRVPAAGRLAFQLERLIYGIPPGAAVDRADADAIAPPRMEFGAANAIDTIVDCSGRAEPARGPRALTVLFDGVPGEIGILAALLDDRPVSIAIEDSERLSDYATALPAIADRKIITSAIDNACSIAVDLIIKALERHPLPATRRLSKPGSQARRVWSVSGLAYVASSVSWKMSRLLSVRLAGHEQWSVAYRKIAGGNLISEGRGEFTFLPDDGRRYFADPFVMRHNGRTLLFVEEFPYNTMRGRIAVAEIENGGHVTSPRPALEESYHLSYPNVFEHDGEIWMIPESGANATIDLYRAAEFPTRWVREARLLEGVVAYDATLLHDEAGWWMFAATRLRRGTGWDSLSIFSASDLRGPWRSCERNPAVLDARAARPAGSIISSTCGYLRPVQDCEAYYGAAIGLWRIDRIDGEAFEQTQIARIVSNNFGVHTYNAAGALEVVDAFGKTRGRSSVTLTCAGVRPLGPGAFLDAPDAAASAAWTTSTQADRFLPSV
jgi:hypothetical protein